MTESAGSTALLIIDVQQGLDEPSLGARYSAETAHALALANLHDEFATVMTTDQILRGD